MGASHSPSSPITPKTLQFLGHGRRLVSLSYSYLWTGHLKALEHIYKYCYGHYLTIQCIIGSFPLRRGSVRNIAARALGPSNFEVIQRKDHHQRSCTLNLPQTRPGQDSLPCLGKLGSGFPADEEVQDTSTTVYESTRGSLESLHLERGSATFPLPQSSLWLLRRGIMRFIKENSQGNRYSWGSV